MCVYVCVCIKTYIFFAIIYLVRVPMWVCTMVCVRRSENLQELVLFPLKALSLVARTFIC